MRVLGLDTATPLCGVAVYDSDSGRSAVRRERVTTHSDRLLSLIAACLEELSLSPADLQGVACGAGPGSFTGLRIGASTAKGLCLALGAPLVLVSSLEVLAAAHQGAAPLLLPCIDAWRGQVYARLFAVDAATGALTAAAAGTGAPAALLQAAAWEPAALREAAQPLAARLAVCGDGALRHPELCPAGALQLEGAEGAPGALGAASPDPLVLARLGAARLLRGISDDLAGAVPDYACPSAAELNLGLRSPAG